MGSGVERAKTQQNLTNYKLINNQSKTADSSHFLYTLLPAVYFFVIIFKIFLKKYCLCKYINYLYTIIKNNNTKK